MEIVLPFVIGFSLSASLNVWLISPHNIVPEDIRGRYFAIDGVLSSIRPAAIAAGAVLITQTRIKPNFILYGALLLASILVFSLMGNVWTLDGRAQEELAN